MVYLRVLLGLRSIVARCVCGQSGFIRIVRVQIVFVIAGAIGAILAERLATLALWRQASVGDLMRVGFQLPLRCFCDNAQLAAPLTAFVKFDWNRNANTLSSCWAVGWRLVVRGLGLCRGVGSGGGPTSQLVHVRRACSGRFGRAAGSRQGGSVGRVARSGSEQAPANLYCTGLQDHTQ